MQISKNYYSQTNFSGKKEGRQAPSFKGLLIEPKITSELKRVYHPILDELVKNAKSFNHEFWDLKVVALCSAPLLILANKKHMNEYVAIPEKIDAPTHSRSSGKSAVPITMNVPYSARSSFFKTDIISGEDHSVENRRQQIYLECKNDAEAQELQSMLCKLQNEHNNSLSNMSFSDNFAANYLKYPLFLLDKLDEASIAKAKADTEVSPQPKKVEDKYVSLGEKKNNIVKKADLEVISGAKPVSSDGEKIGFAKVAGMEELKETLREDVILPLQQVELYKKYGITPANGIILYGPPGTGKTFIAEALAEESGRTFLRLDVANVESKYVGETPKNIVEIFKQAEENAPSVIFIDELEALAPSRATLDSSSSAGIGYNQNVNTLLQCMNNCAEKGVFVIAATNEPQKVDSAIKRVGRIDKNIFVSPPDYMARKELFKMLLKDIYSDENINFDNLAKLTENYTAPEIKQVIIRQASLAALKQNRKVSEADIVTQIKKYTPQLDTATIEEYKKKGAKNKSEVKNQRQRIGFN